MDTEQDENLPSVAPEFPVPAELQNVNASLLDVQLMNVKWDHYIFTRLADAWRKADTIGDIGACMAMTHRAIEKHRDHLLMPNAHKSTTEKASYVYPLD